mgnify:CR=1 FL=1|tara:strand:+ start:270 stop:422 length:153 start_codon:yes stop_codon:yes gene_type:complete
MTKFEDYLETLSLEKLEKMYSLIFGNPIEHYLDMERGQMIDEILDGIKNK